MLVAYLVPGIEVTGVWGALITAIVLGIINVTLKPLFVILTLPINIITLGLFTFRYQCADAPACQAFILQDFEVNGFSHALTLALLLISLILLHYS
jgi:putative membrane protein